MRLSLSLSSFELKIGVATLKTVTVARGMQNGDRDAFDETTRSPFWYTLAELYTQSCYVWSDGQVRVDFLPYL